MGRTVDDPKSHGCLEVEEGNMLADSGVGHRKETADAAALAWDAALLDRTHLFEKYLKHCIAFESAGYCLRYCLGNIADCSVKSNAAVVDDTRWFVQARKTIGQQAPNPSKLNEMHEGSTPQLHK